MNLLKLYLAFLIILICFVAIGPLSAQNIPQNLSSVNIADYTDAQLKTYLSQAQASGVSDSQIIAAAQSRGMSADQIQLLQTRIANIRNNQNGAVNNDTTRVLSRTADSSSGSKMGQQANPAINAVNPQIFGANLFRGANTTFEPNLKVATPVNYILGPDDQLIINISGNSLANWTIPVSLEGNINIPGIGLMKVAGKTIEQATNDIKNKLIANKYALGHGTSLQVSLGQTRTIKIIITGEVVKPGTYSLTSLASAFNALYAAGGPNNNGSFRDIEIIRDNHIIRHLDIYDFLVKGDQKDNINLHDQDIIRVPTYRIRVDLSGQVKIPALFEVLPGETLYDVIKFAGGFSDQAYTANITAFQIINDQYQIIDIPESDYKNYVPLRGDKYIVNSILTRFENRVTIAGAVFRPGQYQLYKGMTVSQLIQKAAGLVEDAFTGHASITRLKPDNTTEIIPFNLKDIINKSIADIPLKREDIVTISSIFDLRDQYNVTINGEVRHPGSFTYLQNMSVIDLIVQAGGFNEGASPKRIEVARRISDSDPESKNSLIANVFSIDVNPQLKAVEASFKLQPFDIVSVYTLPGYQAQSTIRVEGEVLYPGPYTIQKKDEKISDAIARAGGLTALANIDGATLKRSNTAILGISPTSKTNVQDIVQEQNTRINTVKQLTKDTSATNNVALAAPRNDNVGIDLKKILANPGSSIDLVLEDGDILRVPKIQQVVRVNGEVFYASAVVYSEGKSFNSYVLNAGGYAPEALKGHAYVVYPNGTVKGTRKFLFFNNYPEIKPGSEIFVPKKPTVKPQDPATTIAVATGMASLGAIVLGILNLLKL